MPSPTRRLILLIAATGLLVGSTAYAGLGEPVAQLQKDRLRLQAGPALVTRAAAYDRHDLTTANGIRLSAFAARDGRVFAVTFNGPAMPDLKALLGNRFSEYAAAVHPSPTTHKVYTHSSGTLELSIVKLPRGFTGSAFVPGAVPAGVDARLLQ